MTPQARKGQDAAKKEEVGETHKAGVGECESETI